jgi:UPF0716 protein FxsA
MCDSAGVLRLLLLFLVLPALELALLIELGRRIGTASTIGIIVLTGVVGAGLARSQGLAVIRRVQSETASGRLPASELLDGLMILIASALLVTPGILTDAFGFACLTPGFRSLVKREVLRRFERAMAEQRLQVHVEGVAFETDFSGFGEPRGGTPFEEGRGAGEGDVIDVTPAAASSSAPTRRDSALPEGDERRGG